MDEKQKSVILMNIEYVTEEFNKERRRLIGKGVRHVVYVNIPRIHALYSIYMMYAWSSCVY